MRTCALLTFTSAVLFAVVTAANASPVAQPSAPSVTAAAPVQVADSSQTAPGAAAKSAPGSTATAPKKICKLLPSSYSHTSQRVCLTKEEWKQVEEESR